MGPQPLLELRVDLGRWVGLGDGDRVDAVDRHGPIGLEIRAVGPAEGRALKRSVASKATPI